MARLSFGRKRKDNLMVTTSKKSFDDIISVRTVHHKCQTNLRDLRWKDLDIDGDVTVRMLENERQAINDFLNQVLSRTKPLLNSSKNLLQILCKFSLTLLLSLEFQKLYFHFPDSLRDIYHLSGVKGSCKARRGLAMSGGTLKCQNGTILERENIVGTSKLAGRVSVR
ncbi:hypothetical protein BC830DRAFT_1216775 [Chytriomyces sp. MP71]|nr:hypothetical protein BC830DRAFT_1216775 [Chytriomyces sp. MP71]